MVELEEVQAFFFKAMRKGWAGGGAEKVGVPSMPGHRAFSLIEGGFRLLDQYCTTPHTNKSAGTTTIWHQDVVVWVMSYDGRYSHRAAEFVKGLLLKTYNEGRFFGGRGPKTYALHGLVYDNIMETNTFGRFSGREEVYEEIPGGTVQRGEKLGWHRYMGMSLLPDIVID